MTRVKKFLIVMALSLVAALIMIGSIPYLSVYAASGTITLTAYSYFKDGDGLGHSWISVENDTNNTYFLGAYVMDPGETVTVGIWGNLEDSGVWYNVESYGIDEFGLFNGHVSISETITEEELASINSYIAQHDSWSLVYNCSVFVKEIWNMVSNKELSCGFLVNLPAWLCDSIRDKAGCRTNRYIPTNSKIGYVNDNRFFEKVPEDLSGSTSSSAAAYVPQNMQSSFPEADLEQVVTAQLEAAGSELTYAEYLQWSCLAA